LPSYINNFSFNPYVNVFSKASSFELVSRNILLYFKINNFDIIFLPFIFLIFYVYTLSKLLDSLKINKHLSFLIAMTILLSKIGLYQNFHSYRLYFGIGYVFFILSFYFKNNQLPYQAFKINFLLLFSILFHGSLAIVIVVFNLHLILNKIRNKKFFINSIIIIFLYFSYLLIYKKYFSNLLFEDLIGGKYIISKISWFGIHYTGSNIHLLYYIINPIMIGIIIAIVNYLDFEKKKGRLELFVISSLLLMILFSHNTFIWKRIFYMFFPFYILIFYIHYDYFLSKLKFIKVISKIDLSIILIINIFFLKLLSDFYDLKIKEFYFIYILMFIIILKFINYSIYRKNYNILLFIPYLNITYLSILSLSFIELYR